MVICLERGADLHIAQLMPLPLTVSCFSKIQIDFSFLGSPGKGPLNRCVCVCVSVLSSLLFPKFRKSTRNFPSYPVHKQTTVAEANIQNIYYCKSNKIAKPTQHPTVTETGTEYCLKCLSKRQTLRLGVIISRVMG